MSRLFESFALMDRGWDVRVLENQPLRSIFLWLLPLVFSLGAITALMAYQIFRLHRLNWSMVLNLAVLAFLAFRYARLIYRRLGR
jgi:positive regulator of sigma E activity